ncbi:MAG: NAD-dependent epimerase/dehydratase family protein [Schleiferiaceae bacterium]
MKIGITGSNGFVGYHLTQFLKLEEKNRVVNFKREWFHASDLLDAFVLECDVIVHLAGINRHESEEELYRLNVEMGQQLADSLARTDSSAHVIMSSSTQEERDNPYGNSKKVAREALSHWAKDSKGQFTGLLIPNVFGPFGKPNYNSVVATFCHKIANGESPEIHVDGEIGLIYVLDLVQQISNIIESPEQLERESGVATHLIPFSKKTKVSELLIQLNDIKEQYMDKFSFPSLVDEFDKALFNTFRCYVPSDFYPAKFVQHTDNRGAFVELARTDTPGQTSFSTTVPGITRGNHYHTRKAERFAVIKGKALIQLRKIGTDEVINYELDGNEPSFVDMPIWTTHNIKNVGEEELVTVFWINEPFDANDPDTYFEEV